MKAILKISIFTILITTPAFCSADIQTGLLDYWSFDGKDVNWATNTAIDKKDGNNNVQITSMSTSTAASAGVIGQALRFDGVNDFLDGTGYTMTVFTVSAWIKTSQVITTFEGLVDWSDSSQRRFGIGLDPTGDPVLIYVNASNQNRRKEAAGVNVDDMKWHHIVGIFDGSDTYMYVDGKTVTLGAEINDLSTATNASDLRIGQHTAGSFFFPGQIDEVRIYNRALTSDDVYQLYEMGQSKIASIPFGNLNSSLIGYWTLDGKDTNWATNTTLDRSGNGNTGTITNMSTTTSPISGKVGQALSFDGVNDVVSAGDINAIDGATNLTISAWMKRNTTNSFVTLGKSEASARRVNVNMFNDGRIYFNVGNCTSATYGYFSNNDRNWHHVVMVYDGSQSTNATKLVVYLDGEPQTLTFFGTIPNTTCSASSDAFTLGRDTSSSNFSNGYIDEVRVYSKSLTANEVTALYKSGSSLNAVTKRIPTYDSLGNGLIGHWTLDGKNIDWSLNRAVDISPTANHGTFVNISTTSDIRIGKIGQAIRFNGASTYLEIPRAGATVSGAMTHAAWIKQDELADYRPIFGNINGQQGSDGQSIMIKNSGSTNNIGCVDVNGEVPNGSLQRHWHHVACVYDGTNEYVYLNGVLVTSGAAAYTTATENNVKVGAHNGATNTFFKGIIDDARIYNRALSGEEVKRLYLMGVSKRR